MNQRVHIAVRGAVQGVGFRPFIYRLASDMGLSGWVLNSPQGVFIEAEGTKNRLDEFVLRIEKERPPRSSIQSLEHSFLDPLGYSGFEIRESDTSGACSTLVLPTSPPVPIACEKFLICATGAIVTRSPTAPTAVPALRSIESLPYDRANTSMRNFKMCADCRREYEDPLNRRFHAQPNACPRCAGLIWSCGEMKAG